MRAWEYYYKEIEIINKISVNDKWSDQKILYKNRIINNPIKMGSGGDAIISGNLSGDWWSIVQEMGKWYEQNIHTYQGTREKPRSGRKKYSCSLLGGKNVMDDCSSFVTACVQCLLQKNNKAVESWFSWPPCTASMQPGSTWDKTLRANGWQYIPFDKNILKQGDIYCGGPATHVEICAGIGKQYGWGSVHDGQGGKPGMPCDTSRNYLIHGKPYLHIWRKI